MERNASGIMEQTSDHNFDASSTKAFLKALKSSNTVLVLASKPLEPNCQDLVLTVV